MRHALKLCKMDHPRLHELGFAAELAQCLKDMKHCPSQQSHLRHLATHLQGVAALALTSPACLLSNTK